MSELSPTNNNKASTLITTYLFFTQLILLTVLLAYSHTVYSDTNEPSKKIEHVTVKRLKSIILQAEQSAPAHVSSLNQSQLSTQISAEVKKINVDIGDTVKKGSLLVELDCRDYYYAKQQAKATYLARKAQAHFAEKTFQRNKKLILQSTIPQSSLEQAESDHLSIQEDLKALKAQYKNTELIIERCTIKAPFSGQITQRYVQKGQLVIPNTPVLELLQTAKLRITAELSANKANSIKHAKQVFFNINGNDTPVHLDKIVALIKENTQTQTTRFSLVNNKHQLIAGETGRIVWQHNKPQLPADYLSQRNGQQGVLIAQRKKDTKQNKNQATVKFISLPHAQEGQATDITLPPSTLIIDSGRLLVNDKQMVTIE
jgi:RND family efflux transporter MFP subunit